VSERDTWPAADRTLDATGDRCPMPIVKTAETIREMAHRDILEVLSDDPSLPENLPAWCDANGQTLVKMARGEQTDVYHGFVRKESSLST
jgi:tRNA 2-thiouridine synthesizing protein A